MSDFVQNRYHVMRSLLRDFDTNDKVLLDLGAGPNPITDGLPCIHRILVDVRPEHKPTLVCNLYNGIALADNTIDLIVAGEIIEHIALSRHFLAEILRVLKNGGYLLLSAPNITSLKYRVAFLLGRIPAHAAKGDYTYNTDNPANSWGHVRDYNYRELRRVLTDNGFKVKAERSIGLHLAGKRIIPPWMMPVAFSDNIIVLAEACK
jgi:predicted SAM-dependent methyltransferase